MTTPPLTRTSSFGAIAKLSFHVPAAAVTSSNCDKSGSMNMRNLVLWPNGDTASLMLATYAGQFPTVVSG